MATFFGQSASSPQVRLSRPSDVNKLTNLDLKCYHYPLEFSDWQTFLKNINDTSRVVVLEFGNRTIGFAAWELIEEKHEDSKGKSYVEITRIGVLPEERRKGYGSILLKNVEDWARKAQADSVVILVPEIHCNPGDPDDVSVFLNKCGYKATGIITYNYQRMYGQLVDGFYFGKDIL